MAKTTAADATYQQGRWHLAQILRVRWASMPGVGTDTPPVLALQIKLTVTHRWPPAAQGVLHPGAADAAREDSDESADAPIGDAADLEVVNGAAVIYVACDADRRPLTSEGNLFLGDLGIGRGHPGRPGAHARVAQMPIRPARQHLRVPVPNPMASGRWCLGYEHGLADTPYGIQPAPSGAQVGLPRAWCRRPERGRAGLRAVSPRLVCPEAPALRYDSPYRRVDLGIDAWAEAGREPPSSAAIYQAVTQLKKILKPSGLDLPRPTSRGYCLKILEAHAAQKRSQSHLRFRTL